MSETADLRSRLTQARLYLIFTPSAVLARDPLEVLDALWPWIDAVQVRVKASDSELDPLRPHSARLAGTNAAQLFDWCERVLELRRSSRAEHVLVIANDRVDVARSLVGRGLDGVHLGQDDTPPRIAREWLGPAPLIGWSTHSTAQIAASFDEPVDYLGFGPVRETATKGYVRGLGVEAAWIAASAAHVPVFPIGGIGLSEAEDLVEVGRVAVSSAILSALDPPAAARAIRAELSADAP